jgi:hypothetical protein
MMISVLECSVVDRHYHFGGTYCICLQHGWKKDNRKSFFYPENEALGSSDKQVQICHTV